MQPSLSDMVSCALRTLMFRFRYMPLSAGRRRYVLFKPSARTSATENTIEEKAFTRFLEERIDMRVLS